MAATRGLRGWQHCHYNVVLERLIYCSSSFRRNDSILWCCLGFPKYFCLPISILYVMCHVQCAEGSRTTMQSSKILFLVNTNKIQDVLLSHRFLQKIMKNSLSRCHSVDVLLVLAQDVLFLVRKARKYPCKQCSVKTKCDGIWREHS